jgi:hypothetical protein
MMVMSMAWFFFKSLNSFLLFLFLLQSSTIVICNEYLRRYKHSLLHFIKIVNVVKKSDFDNFFLVFSCNNIASEYFLYLDHSLISSMVSNTIPKLSLAMHFPLGLQS